MNLENLETVQALLNKAGFTGPFKVQNLTTIVKLISPKERYGIYILFFADEAVYVGQSADIVQRYLQHRQKHTDIIYFAYRPYKKGINLHKYEAEMVELFESEGYRLRNIQLTDAPLLLHHSDFSLLISEEEQNNFFTITENILDSQYRYIDAELQSKYAKNFQKLKTQTCYPALKNALYDYLRLCIPLPMRTEQSYWILSCVIDAKKGPNKKRPGAKRFTKICGFSINGQEVLTCYTEGSIDDEIRIYAMLRKSVALVECQRLEKELGEAVLAVDESLFYKPGGEDQFKFDFPLTHSALIFQNDTIVSAIKMLNMYLMRKGPTIFSRFHCFDLVSDILSLSAS